MEMLSLRITARSPLAFPLRKPGTQFRASLPFVPGTAIYGALGMWFGNEDRFDSELFRQIRCHNAYPADPTDAWVRPLPVTAIQPKGAEAYDPPVPPVDALVARVCWEVQQPAALIYAPTDAEGRPWEAAGSKFYTLKDNIEVRSVTQRTMTRVGINRRRGTAEDQRLYSFQALSEVTEQRETQFCGSLVCPAGTAVELTAALGAITHLGGRQTTGMGAVEITPAQQTGAAEDWQAVQGRVNQLTQRFQSQVELYQDLGGSAWHDGAGNVNPIADQSIFTINLLSDAILLEHGWVPTNVLSGSMLEEITRSSATGYPGIKARLLRAFTTPNSVGGWNVSWQRPKSTEVAVTMGGLFVFQAEQPLQREDYSALAQLQLDGIGERRAEGYGQVRICDEFHLLAAEEDQ
jgi:CRISPR-associated protein Csx10